MSNYVFITDSACGLTAEYREKYGVVDYLPGVVVFPDGHEEEADLDWTKMTPEAYFDSMTEKTVLYKTSFCPSKKMCTILEKQLKLGNDILIVTMSSGMSGTYQAALKASTEMMKAYPERKIIVVDTLRYSSAISFLMQEASKKKAEGLSLEDMAAWMTEYKNGIHQIGTMDDLYFCVKTGRLSNFKAFFGSMAGVKPVADFNQAGLPDVIGKLKGKKPGFSALLKYIEQTAIAPESQVFYVSHSNREELANEYKQAIIDKFHPVDVIINKVDMSCGASIGPGLCSAYYHGVDITADLAKEREILANAIAESKQK